MVSWSFCLLLIPTIAYLMASVAYGIQKNYPLSIVYFGYAFANTGLLWLDRLMAKH